LAQLRDSEEADVRGRVERVLAMLKEREGTGEHVLLSGHGVGALLILGPPDRFSSYLKVERRLVEFNDYVNNHPSWDRHIDKQ
jgi:hypothetical protein